MSIKLGEILEHLDYISSIIKLKSILSQDKEPLGQYLLKNNLLTKEQLEEALKLQKLEIEELAVILFSNHGEKIENQK